MSNLQIMPTVPEPYLEYLRNSKGDKNMQTNFEHVKVIKDVFVQIKYSEVVMVDDTPKIAASNAKKSSVPIHNDFKEALNAVAFHVPFITKAIAPNKYNALHSTFFLKETHFKTNFEQADYYEPNDILFLQSLSISEIQFVGGDYIKISVKTEMEDVIQTREISLGSADYTFNPELSNAIESLKNEMIQFLYFGKYNSNAELQLKLSL